MAADQHDVETRRTEAERLFAEHFARACLEGESEGEVDFEPLFRSHPQLERELRHLHRGWQIVGGVLGGGSEAGRAPAPPPPATPTGAGELEADITVEDASADLSAEIVARLSRRAGAFERYRLGDEVGRGGMGTVLRIWDQDLRRDLAMKVLREPVRRKPGDLLRAADARTLGRFLEEAQVTGQLDHPNIVPVHELGLDSRGRIYFTMKLVKGRTLSEVFDLVQAGEEGWTLPRALGVLLRVCDAMAYAHSKHVLHRDLKPANVMVGRFGEVFVMDWGLARVLERRETEEGGARAASGADRPPSRARPATISPVHTMDGDVLGTPAYMSPEAAAGQVAQAGPHSDVYSLGAILYHLLSGAVPYFQPGPRPSGRAVLAMLLQWSAQIGFNSDSGLMECDCGTSGVVPLPLIQGDWVSVRAEYDLDADNVDIYYHQAYVASYPPSAGVFGTSSYSTLAIDAIDLYPDVVGNPNVTPVYYDDFVVRPMGGTGSVGIAICFGDGSGTSCPCGNTGPPGGGCANSTGSGAVLGASGSAVAADNDLTFAASLLIPGQPVLLFVGNAAINGGNGIPFGDGLRCAGQNVVRLGVRVPDANGDASWGPTHPVSWNAGDTRHFQAWYRDPFGGPCGNGFNLSNALTVTFL